MSVQLFAGSVEEFSADVQSGRMVPRLREEFARQILSRPSESEVRSWEVSLAAVNEDMVEADIKQAGILVEHMLPLTSKRLDVMLFGHDRTGGGKPLVVELKQWTSGDIEDVEGRLVVVGNRLSLHPQQQVAQYVEYLRDFSPVFHEGQAELGGAAYLHNATEADVGALRSPDLDDLAEYPLITGEQAAELQAMFDQRLGGSDGRAQLEEYMRTRARPSRKLLDHVADEIESHPEFVLLDDQLVAFEAVRQAVERARISGEKTVVIVTGGPGTGKSVIATRMLGDFARKGWNVSHATGSRSFTLTLRRQVSRRASNLFRYFNSFSDTEPDTLDVLICDEAHRIRESSNNRFTPRAKRSKVPQVQELIEVARVPVFLLDENQVVRPYEIGTVDAIETAAADHAQRTINVQLDGQFRCMGSEAYIAWVARLLGIADGGPVEWDPGADDYELVVASSPADAERWLAEHQSEEQSARLAAGFCWPWSDPTSDGTLIEDIVIGDWRRPWNAKPNKRVKDAPAADYWASDPRGFGQVGCIYTAQGFEYDYGGVIMGRDFVWREGWEADSNEHEDTVVKRAPNLGELVRNVYKVLLTRSLRGGVVYSMDEQTQALLERVIPTRA